MYNNPDLDVNNFYIQTRNINVPISEYKFFDSVSSLNVNVSLVLLFKYTQFTY